MKRAILMNAKDNVATAVENLEANSIFNVVLTSQEIFNEIRAKEWIPFGQKVALYVIEKGEEVTKYGELIGAATRRIEVGEKVHIHNVKSNRLQLPELWYREEGI